MTRLPNPPKVLLNGLTIDEQRKVIRLALEVVYELGKGNEWAAFEIFETAGLDIESRIAFGSLLNSQQGAVMASLGSAAVDVKERRD